MLNKELLIGPLLNDLSKCDQSPSKADVETAKAAIGFDKEVDQKERDIEALCIKLLLQQQPVAGDLRLISAAMKMITDMERIGDQAADISEIVIHLSGTPYIKKLVHLPLMADGAINMVSASLDAYVAKDLGLVRRVIEMDDVIDNLFDIIKNELIGHTKDAAYGTQAIDL